MSGPAQKQYPDKNSMRYDEKHQPFALINIGSISRVQTFSLQVEQSEIISPITWVVMLASLP